MKEIWKDIKGFDNYEVSTEGQVRNKKTGLILKGNCSTWGYLKVNLYTNGKATSKLIHRLVAEAFVPNPDNKSDVNHINEIKTDNRVKNLEWMTSKENNSYGTRIERVVAANSIPIYTLYPDGADEYFPSATIAAKELGLSRAHIVQVLKGQRKTTGGLRFEYAE